MVERRMSALPKWKCHKVVEAAKVVGVTFHDGAALHLGGGARERVGDEWLRRNARGPVPESVVGGYFVRYEDGYTSWSPADVFEAGYTRLDRSPRRARPLTKRKEKARG